MQPGCNSASITVVETSVVDVGLVIAAFLFGLRHGVDWDHIAAITDITAAQDTPRRGVWYGTLYAIGHAVVVLVLGIIAILVGSRLPDWVDEAMGRVVGATLLALGIYVTVSLVRHGKDFRLQSRWMLVLRGLRRVRHLVSRERHLSHDHPHVAVGSFHHDGPDPSESDGRVHGHTHHHPQPDNYGVSTSLTIGALHGVGAETPSQVLIFLAAAGAGGTAAGLIVLLTFVIGLIGANTVITLAAASGFVSATRHPRVYLALGTLTALVSLVLGVVYLVGADSLLPALMES